MGGHTLDVGARAGHWGPVADYVRANVQGTDHVLAACASHGIERLVHTSTPSVVHAGGDLEGVDEALPYPARFHAHYPATKAFAERRVLAANGRRLRTVVLRPHLIWGPGDNHLLPRIVARATATAPQDRYPSVDEFGSALRRAVGLPAPSEDAEAVAALWPVTGIDGISSQILEAGHGLPEAGLLRLSAPPGSGRTALLRRLAWSLGVEGKPVVLFDMPASDTEIEAELASRLGRIAVVEGDPDRGLLEARLHGATAVMFQPPPRRPRPWPRDAGLVLVLYGSPTSWVADLPALAE